MTHPLVFAANSCQIDFVTLANLILYMTLGFLLGFSIKEFISKARTRNQKSHLNAADQEIEKIFNELKTENNPEKEKAFYEQLGNAFKELSKLKCNTAKFLDTNSSFDLSCLGIKKKYYDFPSNLSPGCLQLNIASSGDNFLLIWASSMNRIREILDDFYWEGKPRCLILNSNVNMDHRPLVKKLRKMLDPVSNTNKNDKIPDGFFVIAKLSHCDEVGNQVIDSIHDIIMIGAYSGEFIDC